MQDCLFNSGRVSIYWFGEKWHDQIQKGTFIDRPFKQNASLYWCDTTGDIFSQNFANKSQLRCKKPFCAMKWRLSSPCSSRVGGTSWKHVQAGGYRYPACPSRWPKAGWMRCAITASRGDTQLSIHKEDKPITAERGNITILNHGQVARGREK